MLRYAIPLFAAPLAIAAMSAPAAAAEIQIQATGPVVELTVTESVRSKPDMATVGTGVTTQATTATEAMRLNAEKMNAVIARIKQLGIKADDIQTSGINLSTQYNYDQETQRQVFVGYHASNRVSVVLRKIDGSGKDSIGGVLDALVAAGATEIDGPIFSRENDADVLAQARKAAVASAAAQAKAYADMTGYSGVRLLEVSETSYASPPMPYARDFAVAQSAKAPTPVEPGLVASSVTLTVKYELTR